jgi:hypothetical protein
VASGLSMRDVATSLPRLGRSSSGPDPLLAKYARTIGCRRSPGTERCQSPIRSARIGSVVVSLGGHSVGIPVVIVHYWRPSYGRHTLRPCGRVRCLTGFVRVPDSWVTSKQAVNFFAMWCTARSWIFQPIDASNDFGKDGYVDITDDDARLTGELFRTSQRRRVLDRC